MNKRELSKHMSELGKVGAAARTKALSVERRKEIASNAANARWKRHFENTLNKRNIVSVVKQIKNLTSEN